MQKILATDNKHDTITAILDCIPRNGRLFMVSGKGSFEKSGASEIMQHIATETGISLTRFCEFDVNPNSEDLEAGISACKEAKPDAIIAIGGGSVIDMAKLIRYYSGTASLPMTAIPTTAGTGSESTQFAVLYRNGIKTSVDAPAILPDCAILSSCLTESNTPYQTACSGFDALAQAIEAFWNKNATEVSDSYACQAIEMLLNNIEGAVKSPDRESRRCMLLGSNIAGKAINITRTTAPHAFSYPFTSHYGYPHGHAVALTFPAVAEFNFNHKWQEESRKGMLLELLRIKSCESIFHWAENLKESIGLPPISHDVDCNLIAAGVNVARLRNNPVEISPDDAVALIAKMISR